MIKGGRFFCDQQFSTMCKLIKCSIFTSNVDVVSSLNNYRAEHKSNTHVSIRNVITVQTMPKSGGEVRRIGKFCSVRPSCRQ